MIAILQLNISQAVIAFMNNPPVNYYRRCNAIHVLLGIPARIVLH